MPNQFPFNEKLTKFPNNQSRDGNDHKYFPTSIYLSLDSSHRKENREEEKIRKERYLRGRGTIFSPVAALSWHFAPKNGTRVRIKVRRSWREKRRGTRREEERTSEYLATTLHAASQLHPRCTCLPSFCSVPLAERLSKKPNHSSHRFSSIVLASTFMHPFHPPFAPQFDSFTVHTATTLSLSASATLSHASFSILLVSFPLQFFFHPRHSSVVRIRDHILSTSCYETRNSSDPWVFAFKMRFEI